MIYSSNFLKKTVPVIIDLKAKFAVLLLQWVATEQKTFVLFPFSFFFLSDWSLTGLYALLAVFASGVRVK